MSNSREDIEKMLKDGDTVTQIMRKTGRGKSWIYEIKNRMDVIERSNNEG